MSFVLNTNLQFFFFVFLLIGELFFNIIDNRIDSATQTGFFRLLQNP